MFIRTHRLPEKVITNLITYADVTKSINYVGTSFITDEVCIATTNDWYYWNCSGVGLYRARGPRRRMILVSYEEYGIVGNECNIYIN